MASLRGAVGQFAPWTEAEYSILRDAYASGGWKAACAALPHRSTCAIYHAAQRCGAKRRRRWTKTEDKRLRLEWGSIPMDDLIRLFGRPRYGICLRAKSLGLKCGCPDGLEYLSRAAKRTGYSASQLRRILRWAGVSLRESYSFTRSSTRRFHVVDPFEVDIAIERWHATETLEQASRRWGYSAETIKRRMEKGGVAVVKTSKRLKAHYRVESAVIDAVMAS